MGKKYSENEDEILKKHRHNTRISELYKIMRKEGYDRSAKSIEHRCLRLGLYREEDAADGDELTAYHEAVARIQTAGHDFTPYKDDLRTGIPTKPITRKILCLSDWHIPFQRDELIIDILTTHQDADILVIAGDFLDLYAASFFSKNKSIPILAEYQIAYKWLSICSQMFKQVVLLDGNHERRFAKDFRKYISNEVSDFIARPINLRLANGEVYEEKDGIVELTGMNPFDNVHYPRDFSWYELIGKTLFVHPDSYYGPTATGGILRTASKMDKFFRTKLNYDSLVMAHTHHVGEGQSDGVKLMECGCCCGMLDYQKSDTKGRFGTQETGYALIYQDEDGNTDFNASHVVYRGSQWPRKENTYEE